jgi:hypothetical protein
MKIGPKDALRFVWQCTGWPSFIAWTWALVLLSGWIDGLRGTALGMLIAATGVGCSAIATYVTWRELNQVRSATASQASGCPPGLAEWLVALIVPRRRADAVLGDLEERFHRHVTLRSLQRARVLYWAEALRSIGPILWIKAKRLGFLAVVAEIWRRSRM